MPGTWAHITKVLSILQFKKTKQRLIKLKPAWLIVEQAYFDLPKTTNYLPYDHYLAAHKAFCTYQELTGQHFEPPPDCLEGWTREETLLIEKMRKTIADDPLGSIALDADFKAMGTMILFCQRHRGWITFMKVRTRAERMLKKEFDQMSLAFIDYICQASDVQSEFRAALYGEPLPLVAPARSGHPARHASNRYAGHAPENMGKLKRIWAWIKHLMDRLKRWWKKKFMKQVPLVHPRRSSELDAEIPPLRFGDGILTSPPRRPSHSIFTHQPLDEEDVRPGPPPAEAIAHLGRRVPSI